MIGSCQGLGKEGLNRWNSENTVWYYMVDTYHNFVQTYRIYKTKSEF